MTADRETWARQRIGYGRVDAPYWFVGMEEAGKPDEIAVRTAAPPLEDLYEAHATAFGGRYARLFDPDHGPTQSTWRKLIRLLLVATTGSATLAEIRRYQATRWGRRDGETLLTEVFPVASPRVVKDDDKAGLLPYRIKLLRELAMKHPPRFVVAYGTTYADIYKQIFGRPGDRWTRHPGDAAAGELCRNVAIVPHPTAPKQPNERFDLVGRWASQFA